MASCSDSDDDSEFHSHFHASSASSSSASPSPSPPPSPPPIHHNFFAPPFYNRPPTPLPPSPSLTSLLRPSRPTTPDASDAEDLAPLPRASPKVPTYEYYGFVLYLFSSLAFGMYILWSFLPSPFLHALGVHYYPNRWWSLAIPSWIVVVLVYIYVALAAYNTGYLTLGMESVETIVDEAANVATVDGRGSMGDSWAKGKSRSGSVGAGGDKGRRGEGSGAGGREKRRREREVRRRERKGMGEGGVRDWKKIWSTGTDACLDVPLGGVCEVLYGEGRDIDPEEEMEGEMEEDAGMCCG